MDKKMMEECEKMMHSSNPGKALMAAGVAASGGYILKRGLLRNPVVLLSLGVAAGVLAYMFRKEIGKAIEPVTKRVVKTAVKVSGVGKDFVQEQKERLSDIIAEAKEEEEVTAKKEESE